MASIASLSIPYYRIVCLAGDIEQAQLHVRQAQQLCDGDTGGSSSTDVGAGPTALLPRLVAARLDVAQAAQAKACQTCLRLVPAAQAAPCLMSSVNNGVRGDGQ